MNDRVLIMRRSGVNVNLTQLRPRIPFHAGSQNKHSYQHLLLVFAVKTLCLLYCFMT
jgi:hypothetical protein